MVYHVGGRANLSNSPLSHFLAHGRSICATSDSESEPTDAEPESWLLLFDLRTGECERPRLREGRAGEGRARPEGPTDDAEEEELERDESESEPESEPPLLELLSQRSESDELAYRRLERPELRDRRGPERFSLRSERAWSSDLLDAGAHDLGRGSRDRLR